MIDREKFEEQYKYFDAEVLAEIVALFEDEKDDRFMTLHQNLKERDFIQLARNAHSLKGVIGNFMAPVPYRLVCSVEEAALSHDEQLIRKYLSDLEKATNELLAELKEIILF